MGSATYDYGGETVVVTGGSSGIGRAIALAFGDAGAAVVNADIREEPKVGDQPTHERIAEAGGTAAFVETDVSDPEQVEAMIDVADEYGGIDIMVNNAGVYHQKPFLETDEDLVDLHYGVNIKGVYFGVQAAAAKMVKNETSGSIVNLASISSEVAQGEIVQYEASKGAVKMITRSTAVELAPHDIRVNAVAPGVVPTELYEGYSEKYQEQSELDDLIKPIPLNRAGRPRDIARAVLYLASEDASYVTGELLFVDGGWLAI